MDISHQPRSHNVNNFKHKPWYHQRSHKSKPNTQHNAASYLCQNCNLNHQPRRCPAFGKQCSYCKKYNHFKNSCKSLQYKSKRVRVINVSDDGHTVSVIKTNKQKAWFENIEVEGKNFPFKLDTGTDVNIPPLSAFYYISVSGKQNLKYSALKVKAFVSFSLKNLGSVYLTCKVKDKVFVANFLISDDTKTYLPPILGLETCESLNIINIVLSLKSHGFF